MFKAKIYGDFAVKFRAFGMDFGYIKKSISALLAVEFQTPIALPGIIPIPIKFEKFGVKVDAFIAKV